MIPHAYNQRNWYTWVTFNIGFRFKTIFSFNLKYCTFVCLNVSSSSSLSVLFVCPYTTGDAVVSYKGTYSSLSLFVFRRIFLCSVVTKQKKNVQQQPILKKLFLQVLPCWPHSDYFWVYGSQADVHLVFECCTSKLN